MESHKLISLWQPSLHSFLPQNIILHFFFCSFRKGYIFATSDGAGNRQGHADAETINFIRTMKKQILSVITSILLLSACGGGNKTASIPDAGTEIPLHHAAYLTLRQTDDYVVARLRNPWDTTRVLHTYLLIDRDKEMPVTRARSIITKTAPSVPTAY